MTVGRVSYAFLLPRAVRHARVAVVVAEGPIVLAIPSYEVEVRALLWTANFDEVVVVKAHVVDGAVAVVRRDLVRFSAVWETRVAQLRAVVTRGAFDGVTTRDGVAVVEVMVVGALNGLGRGY